MKIFQYKNVTFYYISELDIEEFKSLIKQLPLYLFSKLEKILVYPSSKLNNFDFMGYSKDRTIFINCDGISSNKDLIKVLIHECFHSIEDKIKSQFNQQYLKTCNEYLEKKKKVLDSISSINSFPNPELEYYNTTEYNKQFDFYLHKQIGYDNLYFKIFDIFPNAYSMTSVSEYIAVCFEIYFFENKDWLSKYCSEVYKLITGLQNG
jgi:hypothetical protein